MAFFQVGPWSPLATGWAAQMEDLNFVCLYMGDFCAPSRRGFF